jgi:beta-galactosidase/beta-glucuronidase
VDAFISPENLRDRREFRVQPESEIAKIVPGPQQKRNYFWYQRTFRAPVKREVAILKINKAQFGTAVWLNGKKIGDHYGCFTAGYFNVTGAMNWEGDNLLLVRIGAHPWAVPRSVPTGIDFEKNKWTPGIYDEVSLFLCDNPVIETLQVAPRINPCAAVVQTKIKNYGGPCSFVLAHRVKTWKAQ